MKTLPKENLFELIASRYSKVRNSFLTIAIEKKGIIAKSDFDDYLEITNYRLLEEKEVINRYFTRFVSQVRRMRSLSIDAFDLSSDNNFLVSNIIYSKTRNPYNLFQDIVHTQEAHFMNLEKVIEELTPDPNKPNLLLISVTPTGDRYIRVKEECDDILKQDELKKMFNIFHRTSVAKKYLKEYLAEFSPKFLHFSGHCCKAGFEVQQIHPREQVLVSGGEIKEMLDTNGISINFVFINACDSENVANGVISNSNANAIYTISEIDDWFAVEFGPQIYEYYSVHNSSFEEALNRTKSSFFDSDYVKNASKYLFK